MAKSSSMAPLLEDPQAYLQPLFNPAALTASAPVAAYFDHYGLSPQGVRHRFGFFPSGPYRLVAHTFEPKSAAASGTVVVLHGFFDHSGSLRHLIHTLVGHGHTVAVYDMPGHGLSTGKRASIGSFAEYVTALQDFLALCRRHLPAPYHLVAHSTGAATVLDYLLTAREAVAPAQVVLLAPLVRSFAWRLSRIGSTAVGFVDRFPRTFRKNSSDPELAAFIRRDPLQDTYLHREWMDALYAWNQEIHQRLPRPHPALVIQGTADTTVAWRYNTGFINEKLPGSRLLLLAKARHQLLNEAATLRQRVLDAIVSHVSATTRWRRPTQSRH